MSTQAEPEMENTVTKEDLARVEKLAKQALDETAFIKGMIAGMGLCSGSMGAGGRRY